VGFIKLNPFQITTQQTKNCNSNQVI